MTLIKNSNNTVVEQLNFDTLYGETKPKSKKGQQYSSLTTYLYNELLSAKNMTLSYNEVTKLATDYMIKNRAYFTDIGYSFNNFSEFKKAMKKAIAKYNNSGNADDKKVFVDNLSAIEKLENQVPKRINSALIKKRDGEKHTNVNWSNKFEFKCELKNNALTLIRK